MSKNETAAADVVTVEDGKVVDISGAANISGAEAAITEILATRETPTGIRAALETIRAELDEDAHVLWSTKGPRGTHTVEIAGVLAAIGDNRRIMVVLGFESGGWKLFAEQPGKTGPEQVAALKAV